MDESRLVRGVLRSVLGGRRRSSRRALRFVTGGQGASLWSNPQVLLTAAGLAWGVVETLQQRSSGPTPAPTAAPARPVPPLPGASGPEPAVSAEALRLVRLAVSAASADGTVSEVERAAILEQARQAGVEAVVEHELAHPRPLAEIVAGVTDDTARGALYVMAFAIARGDEQPSGAERIYLAKLAHLLGLDPATVERLERTAGDRIDRGQADGDER